jgi:hypothetical protein
MRYRKADPDEAAAVEFAEVVFNAAVNERNALPQEEKGALNIGRAKAADDYDAHEVYDGRSERYKATQDKVHAAYEALMDAKKSYFRLNVFGMARYCGLMEELGILFEDDPPHPPFPKPGDYGVTWDEVEAVEYPEDYPETTFTDGQLVTVMKFRDEVNRVLMWHGRTDTPGIPDHKFSTNDGWIVLPAEADAAVRIWQQFVAENGEDTAVNLVTNRVGDMAYWLKWITYLSGAVRHDGFVVR